MCRIFVNSGRYHQAQLLFDACIDEFEQDFRPYFNYAQLSCLQGDFVKGLALFNQAYRR